MDIDRKIDTASNALVRQALKHLLAPHFQPVFGAAKPIEHEVAALRALKLLEVIPPEADEYELVRSLRVTKAKARALMYQDALRRTMTEQQIASALKVSLKSARAAKDGAMILVEVPEPFLMDVMRSKVRSLGFLTDGSFSGSVARMPREALSGLIVDLIPKNERSQVAEQLHNQGIEGDDLRGLVTGLIKKFGYTAAGAAGEAVGAKLGNGLEALLTYSWQTLGELLSKNEKSIS